MIVETHQALATALKHHVLGDAPINVSFDTPSRQWMQTLQAPTINLFLYDLREAASRRDGAYEPVRDENGRLIGRRPPVQRWDLHYTVSVFAPQIYLEHQILGVVLRYFAAMDAMPAEVLPPALVETGYPIVVTAGPGPRRGMIVNYQGEMKSGFDMVVNVPMPPLSMLPVAPPVSQTPEMRVGPVPDADNARTASAAETVSGRPPAAPAADTDEKAKPPAPAESQPTQGE